MPQPLPPASAAPIALRALRSLPHRHSLTAALSPDSQPVITSRRPFSRASSLSAVRQTLAPQHRLPMSSAATLHSVRTSGRGAAPAQLHTSRRHISIRCDQDRLKTRGVLVPMTLKHTRLT